MIAKTLLDSPERLLDILSSATGGASRFPARNTTRGFACGNVSRNSARRSRRRVTSKSACVLRQCGREDEQDEE